MARPIAHLHRVESRHVQPRGPLRPPDCGDVLSVDQVNDLFGVREVNGTMYFIAPKVIDTNGPGGLPDSLAGTAFNGQVFFTPSRARWAR